MHTLEHYDFHTTTVPLNERTLFTHQDSARGTWWWKKIKCTSNFCCWWMFSIALQIHMCLTNTLPPHSHSQKGIYTCEPLNLILPFETVSNVACQWPPNTLSVCNWRLSQLSILLPIHSLFTVYILYTVEKRMFILTIWWRKLKNQKKATWTISLQEKSSTILRPIE